MHAPSSQSDAKITIYATETLKITSIFPVLVFVKQYLDDVMCEASRTREDESDEVEAGTTAELRSHLLLTHQLVADA